MTDHARRLVPGPPIVAGAIVSTPTGREARVIGIDEKRGEALIEWLPERAAFRLSRLAFLSGPQVDEADGVQFFTLGAQPAEGER